MVRSMIILVADDPGAIDSCRTFAQSKGMSFQVYSHQEWESRSATGETTLVTGSGPVQDGAKILPFPQKSFNSVPSVGNVRTINQMESEAIEKAIFEFGGNLTEAAKALGIGRATLYRKVKQYNIDPSQARRKRAA